MASHSGPNIIDDGLVFCYDMDNTVKSWKGAPTTNVAATGNYSTNWNNSGTATWTNNDTTISRLFSDIQVNSILQTTDGNSHIGIGYGLISAGNWVSSVYVYIPSSAGTLSGSAPYFRSFPANTSRGVLAYNGNTDWNTWPRDRWIRIERYWNNTANDTNMYISCYTNTTGNKVYFTAPQLEQYTAATPFVNGTRSNTQAILDLTGSNTINATNLSYNNDGTFEFNGSSNFLDLGSDVVFKSTGGWTVDSWVKYDVVPDVYNNTTVPGNFIGAGTITHNSWYWSVYTKRLALWNRSPGIWKYGSTILQPNVWYNATLVCADSGTSYQMYLNGVAEGGDHVSYSWNASYAGLNIRYIGYGNAPNPRRVDGKIAMTKVYNRALTAVEVARNFEANRRRFGI